VNSETKLHLALMQVHNVMNLLQGNEYEKHMIEKLYSVKFEIERQLTNSSYSSKIKE